MLIAVAILFHPDPDVLSEFVLNVSASVDALVLVDNTPGGFKRDWQFNDCVSYIPLLENAGVACAQNVGIEIAIQKGADYVLILDQDSKLSSDMVSVLRKGFDELADGGEKVGAIGACFVESMSSKVSEITRVECGKIVFEPCPDSPGFVKSDTLISSGCLISRDCLLDVGLMADLLFIDWVDLEWCLRAGSKGWGIYMASQARMQHTIGAYQARTIRGRPFGMHSPFRLFYQIRNGIFLFSRPEFSWAWRLLFIRGGVISKVYNYVMYHPQKLSVLRASVFGIFSGVYMCLKYRRGLPVRRLG
jgi:rhamnosyltransferase